MFWSHGDFATLASLRTTAAPDSSGGGGAHGTAHGIAEEGFKAIREFVMATTTCRRKLLLNYFGEQMSGVCSGCDNCDRAAATTVALSAAAAAAAGSSPVAAPAGAGSLHDFTRDVRTLLQSLAFCGSSSGLNRAVEVRSCPPHPPPPAIHPPSPLAS